jgi:hypothetical protein
MIKKQLIFFVLEMKLFNSIIIIAFLIQRTKTNDQYCPSGWEYFENSCYKIYNFAMNYYQAQAYCPAQEESSYLADITSNSEFSWIQRYYQSNSYGDIWVSYLFWY